MSTSIEHLMQALRQVLSLPQLALNDERVCALFIPGGLQVQLEWDDAQHTLLMLAHVGQLDTQDPGAHAQRLLAANFLFAGTRGEALSVEPDTGRVFVCSQLEPQHVSLDHAVEIFSRFVDTAQRWHDHLQGVGTGGDASLAHTLKGTPLLRG